MENWAAVAAATAEETLSSCCGEVDIGAILFRTVNCLDSGASLKDGEAADDNPEEDDDDDVTAAAFSKLANPLIVGLDNDEDDDDDVADVS